VGLLLADLHTGASRGLWPGVADEAAARGINLVCFPGGRLGASDGFEASRNAIYDLAGPECLDGLLSWASTLGGVIGQAELEGFHARYRGLPLVCLAAPAADAPVVRVDAYHGMQAVVSHLIEVHGLKRIAFIRGPTNHAPAEERYRAYLDTITGHGLPIEERLVTVPLRWEAGEEAVRILLDERRLSPGADFQAVVSPSDLLALWALKAFQARGLRVPADVVVTGFNDTAESRLASPPLTTVAMPFREQGARAVRTLMSLMSGEEVSPSVSLPSALVIRQSCGCPSEAFTMAASEDPAAEKKRRRIDHLPEALAEIRGESIAEMTSLAGVDERGKSAWIEPLFDSFVSDIGSPTSSRFLSALDKVLDRAIRADAEIAPWQAAVSALRRRIIGILTNQERARIEDRFAQARVLIDEAMVRERTYRQWQRDRLAKSLRETDAALIESFEVDGIADVMADWLPRLGISSFYLVLYENPQAGLEYARLLLACTRKGRAKLPAGGLLFPARNLIPRAHLPKTYRYDLVVEALHFHERQIGYAVFEVGPRDGTVYDELRGSISSALKGALLLREAREARLAAEKADVIKTRLLANVSHELRAPLSIILQRTRGLLQAADLSVKSREKEDLELIEGNAEHQLRLINDLLDLSRAEIDELDLDFKLMDPRPVLEEVYRDFSGSGGKSGGVEVVLEAPDRLPVIKADALRLRQILLNLMSNALKFTSRGIVRLSAEVCPPFLHIEVSDTGPGIPLGIRKRVFEPFVKAESGDAGGGIGLGLSIAKHLAALHFGSLSLETASGKGTTFLLRLPLPDLSGREFAERPDAEPVLILISNAGGTPPEITEFCKRRGFSIRLLSADSDWEAEIGSVHPAALAWDLSGADPREWNLVRRLRHHPELFQAPVVLYGSGGGRVLQDSALTGFLPKPVEQSVLMDLIDAAFPAEDRGPVLIVDDEESERERQEALVRSGLPESRILTAADGESALRCMDEEAPGLVLLDLAMPGMDGMEVLDRMRASARLRRVPVIVLTNKVLDDADVKRLEAHARVTVQAKGVWSEGETVAAMNRSIYDPEGLPPHTGALVKRAVAWLTANHAGNVTRWKLAEAVNASEDYLCRVFHRELGISPWEFLNRYRVHRARELLTGTGDSVKAIAAAVGFRDQAYFSRVFRKIAGIPPQDYRDSQ
jgi:signal transduction histidine kinase/AraC-like DNA-binding protein